MTVLWNWPDRRPIGTAWIAASDRVSVNNPHGLFAKRLDTGDAAATNQAATDFIDACITRCKSIDAQGLYFHGFTYKFRTTRVEYQTSPPLPMELDRPNGSQSLFNYLLLRVHQAGLRSGCLIRPDAAYGNFMTDPPVFQGNVPHRDTLKWLSRSVDWARPLGMSIFYIDSPGLDQAAYVSLVKKYPDCLFVPEVTTQSPYDPSQRWKYDIGPCWLKFNLNTDYVSQGLASFYAVDHSGDVDGVLERRMRKAIEDQSIISPYCWYDSRGLNLIKKIQGGP
jgi:hypothetical protein